MSPHVKSPLRYPGGKSRQARAIAAAIGPAGELREPFCGGASVSLEWMQLNPRSRVWVNDFDPAIALFWQTLPGRWRNMVSSAKKARARMTAGDLSAIAEEYRDRLDEDAANVFILNRASFSGCLRGGMSPGLSRFTPGSIARLEDCGRYLKENRDRWFASKCDWQVLAEFPGDDVVLFLDPPYERDAGSKLYRGHEDWSDGREMDRVAHALAFTPFNWVLTVDDTPRNRSRFGVAAYVYSWGWSYSSTRDRAKGAELIVSSRPLPGLENAKEVSAWDITATEEPAPTTKSSGRTAWQS